MKRRLAETLLIKVMDWSSSPEQVTDHRPVLQLMAEYKYNEYQRFSPGMRFVENLALWLQQFSTPEEKKIALQFVEHRLIFHSVSEMQHLVEMAYPDEIRPFLLRKTSEQLGTPPYHIARIAQSKEFQVLQRQTLFLALSNGAHTDVFRRANPIISHEQIYQAYDVPPIKAQDMLHHLKKDLEQILGHEPSKEEVKFRVVCLLDDFTASGRSYLRQEERLKKGKIWKVVQSITEDGNGLKDIVDSEDLTLFSVIYMGTQHAEDYIEQAAQEMFPETPHEVRIVHRLDENVPLDDVRDAGFLQLVNNDSYYDHKAYDEHFEKGGAPDAKKGFAACNLPLVLSHNTPNNSVFLLWSSGQDENLEIQGLFPRVKRHQA